MIDEEHSFIHLTGQLRPQAPITSAFSGHWEADRANAGMQIAEAVLVDDTCSCSEASSLSSGLELARSKRPNARGCGDTGASLKVSTHHVSWTVRPPAERLVTQASFTLLLLV